MGNVLEVGRYIGGPCMCMIPKLNSDNCRLWTSKNHWNAEVFSDIDL